MQLFEDRKSAAEMAAELGNGITRNSILGKLHRMGLKSGRSGTQHTDLPRDTNRPKLRVVRANGNSNAVRVFNSIERAPLKIKAAQMPPTIWLDEPQKDLCHYPYGDGPYAFCGHPKLEGSSYCGPHHALCWMPARERVYG